MDDVITMRIVFLAAFVLLSSLETARSTIETRYMYTVQSQVSKPFELTECTVSEVNSQMECFRSCASDLHCVTVYITANVAGESRWACHVCLYTPPIDSIPPGNGIVGRVKRFSAPPVVLNAAMVKIEPVNGIDAAFYQCSATVGAKTFRLAFDEKTGIWPQLNQPCLNTICEQHSLTASMITVSTDSTGFRLDPRCLVDETPDGHVLCTFGGVWQLSTSLGVLCVSTSCSRLTAYSRCVYKGTLSKGFEGRTCQYWTSQSPHGHNYGHQHMFTEDNGQNHHNHCRDPGNNGYLWCYTLDLGKRWDYCHAPQCV